MNSLKLIIIINSKIIFKIIIINRVHEQELFHFLSCFCCISDEVNNLNLGFWYKHRNQILLMINTHSLNIT